MLTGVLFMVVPVFIFFTFSPSPFGPMGSLWGGAVVVRGHPRDIPGFAKYIRGSWGITYVGSLLLGSFAHIVSCLCVSSSK